ncbi:hypothetical protein E5358_07000 [Palleniella muris]|uniref:Uncharacterized protein n=1 Tax=Palleniella muris TaxID=3038145 RepID=A0AC61QQK2_9BACT|nr:FimB/Mfa2 family fimbrial subunit [Palleniella muris]TGX82508.1 hypothetical protein E5358_07000 [Palleniella muris]
MNTLKHFNSLSLLAVMALFLFSSCDGFVYDEEGDCSVTYDLKFRYDMNLKWADAFANEVKSVSLYAFDEDGVLVWKNSEAGGRLAMADYSMNLPLQAGHYRLLAWCGLENGKERESFNVPEAIVGTTRLEDLACRLDADVTAEGMHSGRYLDFLYHGLMEVDLPENPDGGHYTYTMPLVKNTNHIRIILQQLSGENLKTDDFSFRIEDSNGLMASDNSLADDAGVVYTPWAVTSGTAGVGKDDAVAEGRSVVYVNGVIADFSVGRMMADHDRRMTLTVTNKEGGIVARVPVIDYALLSKEYYEQAYGHKMGAQEFLDREDEYVMTFFLDADRKWISTSILIHSWRIVLDNVDLGN